MVSAGTGAPDVAAVIRRCTDHAAATSMAEQVEGRGRGRKSTIRADGIEFAGLGARRDSLR